MTHDFKRCAEFSNVYLKYDVVGDLKDEYMRADIHGRSPEGYLGFLSRAIKATYDQVSKKHLHRYLNEFDFRYNMIRLRDGAIVCIPLSGTQAKRLF